MNQSSENSKSHLLSFSQPLVRTNQVLLQFPHKNNKKFILYLPCYIRLKIINFVQVSIRDLKGKFVGKLMFDVDFTGLPQKLKQYLKYNIKLKFNEDPLILLDKNNPQISMKTRKMDNHQIVGYRIIKQMTAKIIPKIQYTPFQLLYLIYSVYIGYIQIDDQGQKNKQILLEFNKLLKENSLLKKVERKFEVRFNIMDYKRQEYQYFNQKTMRRQKLAARIIYSINCSFGNYDLASRKLKVQYTNIQKAQLIIEQEQQLNRKNIFHRMYDFLNSKKLTKEQVIEKDKLIHQYAESSEQKIQTFNYAHFQIPIYRRPIVPVITIFLPIWLLGFISIGIFFQENDLSSRIGSIATIMLAYISFMPTIRQQIPPTPQITFVQILLYMQITITFLCFLQSLLNRHYGYVFDYSCNYFFLISVVIQGIQTLVIICSCMIYYFLLLPSYYVSGGLQLYFKRQDWQNNKCNKYFEQKMKYHQHTIEQLASLVNK